MFVQAIPYNYPTKGRKFNPKEITPIRANVVLVLILRLLFAMRATKDQSPKSVAVVSTAKFVTAYRGR